MAREAKQLGNHVVEELQDYRRAVEEQDLTKYDGVTVYGADVVNLMKRELKTISLYFPTVKSRNHLRFSSHFLKFWQKSTSQSQMSLWHWAEV